MDKKNPQTPDTSFYRAVLTLQNEEECRAFFEDICALVEMKTIIQRYEVARMLRQDKVYSEIAKELNASSATISRVKRMLNYGTGCIGEVLDRVLEEDRDNRKTVSDKKKKETEG